jgi:hypothetical protein
MALFHFADMAGSAAMAYCNGGREGGRGGDGRTDNAIQYLSQRENNGKKMSKGERKGGRDRKVQKKGWRWKNGGGGREGLPAARPQTM